LEYVSSPLACNCLLIISVVIDVKMLISALTIYNLMRVHYNARKLIFISTPVVKFIIKAMDS